MPRYEVKATQDWQFGDCQVKAGDTVATIETELAPFLLLDGERSGRLQIRAIEEQKKSKPPEPSPEPSPEL